MTPAILACPFPLECSISRHAVPGRCCDECRSWGPDMTNTSKILIVDDDSELREALVEQLALHEEFESIAVDNGTKGVQGGQGRADRSRDHGCGAARRRRARSRAHPAQERLQGAHHHVDRTQYG